MQKPSLADILAFYRGGEHTDPKANVERFLNVLSYPGDFILDLISKCHEAESIRDKKLIIAVLSSVILNYFDKLAKEEQMTAAKAFLMLKEIDEIDLAPLFGQCLAFMANKGDEAVMNYFLEALPQSHDAARRILYQNAAVYMREDIGIKHYTAEFDYLIYLFRSSLESTSWETKSQAIRLLSLILGAFPDEDTSFKENIDKVIELVSEVKEMPDVVASDIIAQMSSLVSSLSPDSSHVESFIKVFMEMLGDESYSMAKRRAASYLLQSCLEYLTSEQANKYGDLMFELYTSFVRVEGYVHDTFLSAFEASYTTFNFQKVHQFQKDKIKEYYQHPEIEGKITAIACLRAVGNVLPHMLAEEIDMFNTYIDAAFRSGNSQLVQIACFIVSEFGKYFARSILDVTFYIDYVFEFLSEANPEVRYAATMAMKNIFKISCVPLEKITARLINNISNIAQNSLYDYLCLIADAVKNEFIYNPDIDESILTFTTGLLESSNPVEYLGGINIASSFLELHEDTHQVIFPSFLKAIKKCSVSDDQEEYFIGVTFWHSLAKIDPDSAMQLYNSALANLSDDTLPVYLVYNGVLGLARLAAVLNVPRLKDFIYERTLTWFNPEDQYETIFAIRSLRKLVPVLDREQVIRATQELSHMAQKTKSNDILTASVDAVRHIVKYNKSQEVVDIACDLCLQYMNGLLRILDGVPPLGTDIMFNPLRVFSELFIQVIPFGQPITSVLYPFCIAVCERRILFKVDLMLRVVSAIVNNNQLPEGAVDELKGLVFPMLTEDTPMIMIHSISTLVISMSNMGYISNEELLDKLPVVMTWWKLGLNEKKRLRSAVASLTLLIWLIALRSNTAVQMDDIIVESLQFVPPDDLSMTVDIIDFSHMCFHEDVQITDSIAIAGVLAMCRLQTLPQLNLRARGVTEETMKKIRDTLNLVRSMRPAAQEAIDTYAKQHQHRAKALTEFCTK